MARRSRGGCCTALHLQEENSRFILLAVVMILYMLFGATIFYYLESDGEERARQRYWISYHSFMKKYQHFINESDLNALLYEYGNATASGLIGKRPRWDFSGSFYFVATIVSTIGNSIFLYSVLIHHFFFVVLSFNIRVNGEKLNDSMHKIS
jgi:hypothetical protein